MGNYDQYLNDDQKKKFNAILSSSDPVSESNAAIEIDSPKIDIQVDSQYLEHIAPELQDFFKGAISEPFFSSMAGLSKGTAAFFKGLDAPTHVLADAIGRPDLRSGTFEELANAYDKLAFDMEKKGIPKESTAGKVAAAVYEGIGRAPMDIAQILSLGKYGLPIHSAMSSMTQAMQDGKDGLEVSKETAKGIVSGALMQGILHGVNKLPRGAAEVTGGAVGAGTAAVEGKEPEDIAADGIVMAALSSMGRKPSMAEFKENFKPIDISNESIQGTYQAALNKFQSIEDYTDKASALGMKPSPTRNPKLLAKQYLGLTPLVQTVLEDKTFRITEKGIEQTGDGLRPILNRFDASVSAYDGKITKQDFGDYLIARRTINDLQRESSLGKKIVTPEQVEYARTKLRELDIKYGDEISQFESHGKEIYDYQKRVLHLLVDGNVLSENQFETIVAQNPNYIPFDRVLETDKPVSMGKSSGLFSGARSPIRGIKGSQREIEDVFGSIVKNTYQIIDRSMRNKVGLATVDLLKENFPNQINKTPIDVKGISLSDIESPVAKTIFRGTGYKPEGNIIEVFRNGKKEWYEVPKNVSNAMKSLDVYSEGTFLKILGAFKQGIQYGATSTPEFPIRNFIRDQHAALMQTKVGFVPYLDPARAVFDILGKSKDYYDWMRAGGGYSGVTDLTRAGFEKQAANLVGSESKFKEVLKTVTILPRVQDISRVLEQATRLAVYKRAIRTGYHPLEAGWESREGTVDFGRKGYSSSIKLYGRMKEFFNASLQGLDKSLRTAKNDPVGLSMKGIATITIPELLLYLKNREEPDYGKLPEWVKDLTFHFKINGQWFGIPKPFLYGQVFGSIPRRSFEYLDKRDPNSFNGLKASLVQSLSPVGGDDPGSLLPVAIRPVIENETNWNFFKARNIVPDWKMDSRLPEDQYSTYTTESAKKLGELFKYSPDKIENLFTGYLGGTGKYTLVAADLLSGKKTKRPLELSDIPGLKAVAVQSQSSSGSEIVQRFYRKALEIGQAKGSYDEALELGNNEKANRILREHPVLEYEKMFVNARRNIGELRDQSREILASKRSDDEKRKLLKEIDDEIFETAKYVLNELETD